MSVGPSTSTNIVDKEKVEVTIKYQFVKAYQQYEELMESKIQVAEELKLRLYALSKQAQQGDCNLPPPPGENDGSILQSQWEAWMSLEGVPTEEAMGEFIWIINHLDTSIPIIAHLSGVTIKQGVLFKQRDHLNGLRPRYFVLQDNYLHYYINVDDLAPRKTLDLSGCSVSTVNSIVVEGVEYFPFVISHPKAEYPYFLASDTKYECSVWVDKIKDASKVQFPSLHKQNSYSDDSNSNRTTMSGRSSSSSSKTSLQQRLLNYSYSELNYLKGSDSPHNPIIKSTDSVNAEYISNMVGKNLMLHTNQTLSGIPNMYAVKIEQAISVLLANTDPYAPDWKFFFERDGVTARRQQHGQGKSGLCIRGDAVLGFSALDIFSLIVDMSRSGDIEPRLKAHNLICKYSNNTWVEYYRVKQFWPMSPRDFVKLVHWRILPDGRIVIVFFSAEDNRAPHTVADSTSNTTGTTSPGDTGPAAAAAAAGSGGGDGRATVNVQLPQISGAIVKQVAGTLRGEFVIGGYVLMPLQTLGLEGRCGTEVRYLLQMDLKGNLPTTIINNLSQDKAMTPALLNRLLMQQQKTGGYRHDSKQGSNALFKDYVHATQEGLSKKFLHHAALSAQSTAPSATSISSSTSLIRAAKVKPSSAADKDAPAGLVIGIAPPDATKSTSIDTSTAIKSIIATTTAHDASSIDLSSSHLRDSSNQYDTVLSPTNPGSRSSTPDQEGRGSDRRRSSSSSSSSKSGVNHTMHLKNPSDLDLDQVEEIVHDNVPGSRGDVVDPVSVFAGMPVRYTLKMDKLAALLLHLMSPALTSAWQFLYEHRAAGIAGVGTEGVVVVVKQLTSSRFDIPTRKGSLKKRVSSGVHGTESPFVLSETKLDFPMSSVLLTILNISESKALHPERDSHCVLENISPFCWVEYINTQRPPVFVAPREFVKVVHWRLLANGCVQVMFFSDNSIESLSKVPKTHRKTGDELSYVLGRFQGGWVLRPTSDGGTVATHLVQGDLGGKLPSRVVDHVMTRQWPGVVERCAAALKRSRKQCFEASLSASSHIAVLKGRAAYCTPQQQQRQQGTIETSDLHNYRDSSINSTKDSSVGDPNRIYSLQDLVNAIEKLKCDGGWVLSPNTTAAAAATASTSTITATVKATALPENVKSAVNTTTGTTGSRKTHPYWHYIVSPLFILNALVRSLVRSSIQAMQQPRSTLSRSLVGAALVAALLVTVAALLIVLHHLFTFSISFYFNQENIEDIQQDARSSSSSSFRRSDLVFYSSCCIVLYNFIMAVVYVDDEDVYDDDDAVCVQRLLLSRDEKLSMNASSRLTRLSHSSGSIMYNFSVNKDIICNYIGLHKELSRDLGDLPSIEGRDPAAPSSVLDSSLPLRVKHVIIKACASALSQSSLLRFAANGGAYKYSNDTSTSSSASSVDSETSISTNISSAVPWGVLAVCKIAHTAHKSLSEICQEVERHETAARKALSEIPNGSKTSGYKSKSSRRNIFKQSLYAVLPTGVVRVITSILQFIVLRFGIDIPEWGIEPFPWGICAVIDTSQANNENDDDNGDDNGEADLMVEQSHGVENSNSFSTCFVPDSSAPITVTFDCSSSSSSSNSKSTGSSAPQMMSISVFIHNQSMRKTGVVDGGAGGTTWQSGLAFCKALQSYLRNPLTLEPTETNVDLAGDIQD